MLIFLVGYMACGKSTIGRKLSKSLQLPLYDTDKEIVAAEGKSVAQIFDTHGEEHFRELESAMIKSLIKSNVDAVISTGGGAPMWGDNMQLMNQSGLTVYLDRTAQNIANRLSLFGREKRPKLRGLTDEELIVVLENGIAQRDARYREAALVVDCNSATDDIILLAITNHLKGLEK